MSKTLPASSATEISARIDILRTLLIAGLVLLHVPPHIDVATWTAGAGPLTSAKLFFGNVLFRASLPTLSVISGYLLFRRFELKAYPVLMRKKFHSLAIPLLLWNLPLVLLLYFIDRYALTSYGFRVDLHPFEQFNFLDATLGLRDQPVNFPLQFLRDLLLCFAIAPVLWFLLRRAAYIGLVLVMAAAFFLPLDGYFFARTEIALFFYLGGMWATRGWSLATIDRHAAMLFGLSAVVGVLISFLAWDRLGSGEHIGVWVRYYRFLGVLGFLALSKIIYDSAAGAAIAKASKWAFWTFCVHGPLLGFMWLAAGPRSAAIDSAAYAVFYAAAPIGAIVASILSYEFCKRYLPWLWSWLVGGRPEEAGTPAATVVQNSGHVEKNPKLQRVSDRPKG